MKEIKLNNSNFTALIDDEDYEKVSKYKWSKLEPKNGNTIYVIGFINKKVTSLHIFLLGKKEGKEIDHKDRNGLNNQRYNLRFLTQSENSRNIGIRPNNTSGYIGVSWIKKEKKYKTTIMYNGKTIHLGYYNCKIKAARVYDSVCKYHFKGIAQLNFPSDSSILSKSIKEIRARLCSKFDVILTNIKTNEIIYKGNRKKACEILNITRDVLSKRIYKKSKVGNIIITKN